MKVLLSWLRDFVDVPGTAEEIGRQMSLRGLALEGIKPTFAQGATVGQPEDSAQSAAASQPDAVLDFEVTANRPDCLSVLGIAREIAAAYDLPLRTPGPGASGLLRTPDLRPIARGAVTVSIAAPDLCEHYAAADVTIVHGPSPAWMQARLRALDVRPISNIVDITNYVLLELGHPLHAFDASTLSDAAIVVRRAAPGEALTTLDGKARTLDADMLVIADATRAAAVAGVMGGAETEVSERTTQVVLESAWFKPQSVRATSRRLGLRTEASYRFERGADRTGILRAMARAAALVDLTGAGTAAGTVIDVCATEPSSTVLSLTAAEVERLLGMHVPAEDIERILEHLGFELRRLGGWQAMVPDAPMPLGATGSSWQVTAPGWRVDIARPVDLIEEVGRHYGFEHLPATFPGVEQAPPPPDWRIGRDQRVRRSLLAGGFSEAVTFAFIEADAAARFAQPRAAAGAADVAGVGDAATAASVAGTADAARDVDAQHDGLVRLANPLSETFAVMRPSLLPGLVAAVGHNRRRERRDVRLFEIGTRFSPAGEIRSAAFAWTGLATPDHWSGNRRDVDFFDASGVVEQVCAVLGVAPALSPMTSAVLVEGRAAAVHIDGVPVGIVGLLAPDVARAHDVPDGDAVYVAELDLDALSARAPTGVLRARPLPRHPSVVRDISILVEDRLSADSVRGTIRAAAPSTLVGVREFDRYQGTGIPEGKVSLSLRLTFQAPDRTLTDAEVQAAMDEVGAALHRELGAVQR